mmetsp:Transcript_12974/g.31655  ORF Transcript_12974/g.31655 Transcript_12974/m.31655 type:complete len:255 (-) Transcript_12974:294-1058(-)
MPSWSPARGGKQNAGRALVAAAGPRDRGTGGLGSAGPGESGGVLAGPGNRKNNRCRGPMQEMPACGLWATPDAGTRDGGEAVQREKQPGGVRRQATLSRRPGGSVRARRLLQERERAAVETHASLRARVDTTAAASQSVPHSRRGPGCGLRRLLHSVGAPTRVVLRSEKKRWRWRPRGTFAASGEPPPAVSKNGRDFISGRRTLAWREGRRIGDASDPSAATAGQIGKYIKARRWRRYPSYLPAIEFSTARRGG